MDLDKELAGLRTLLGKIEDERQAVKIVSGIRPRRSDGGLLNRLVRVLPSSTDNEKIGTAEHFFPEGRGTPKGRYLVRLEGGAGSFEVRATRLRAVEDPHLEEKEEWDLEEKQVRRTLDVEAIALKRRSEERTQMNQRLEMKRLLRENARLKLKVEGTEASRNDKNGGMMLAPQERRHVPVAEILASGKEAWEERALREESQPLPADQNLLKNENDRLRVSLAEASAARVQESGVAARLRIEVGEYRTKLKVCESRVNNVDNRLAETVAKSSRDFAELRSQADAEMQELNEALREALLQKAALRKELESSRDKDNSASREYIKRLSALKKGEDRYREDLARSRGTATENLKLRAHLNELEIRLAEAAKQKVNDNKAMEMMKDEMSQQKNEWEDKAQSGEKEMEEKLTAAGLEKDTLKTAMESLLVQVKDLANSNHLAETKITELRQDIERAELNSEALRSTVSQRDEEIKESARELAAFRLEAAEAQQVIKRAHQTAAMSWRAEEDRLKGKVSELRSIVDRISSLVGALDYSATSAETVDNGTTLRGRSTSPTDQESEHRALREEVQRQREEELEELREGICCKEKQLKSLTERLSEAENSRRSMHNQIIEFYGNIRVIVRVRPFLDHDDAAMNADTEEQSPLRFDQIDPTRLSVWQASCKGDGKFEYKSPMVFTFDRVFGPDALQDQIFEEVEGFVTSALDGYSVCLFSYGQTGSGKTFTLQGGHTGASRGVIPRAVEKIVGYAAKSQQRSALSEAHSPAHHHIEYSLSTSAVEIHNETFRDLLAAYPINGKAATSPSESLPSTLQLKRTPAGEAFIQGLRQVDIIISPASPEDLTVGTTSGQDQLSSLLAVADKARTVGAHALNQHSSRSHCVFTLYIESRETSNQTVAVRRGKLCLCDLAGSERLNRTNAGAVSKERLQESLAINKSLSALSTVFSALANGSRTHVPYRDSKLTQLLQETFSGDGKAMMMINLSPTVESLPESIQSLRFAARVSQIKLGKAAKKMQILHPTGTKSALKELEVEESIDMTEQPHRRSRKSASYSENDVATKSGKPRLRTARAVPTPTARPAAGRI